MSQCVFCRIASHLTPAKIEYEDEQVMIFHDINPQAPVHLLIIPKRHLARIQDMQEGDSGLIGQLFLAATRQAGKMGLNEKGFRLVLNNGRHGGQAVFHIHLHLLGGRPLSWPPG